MDCLKLLRSILSKIGFRAALPVTGKREQKLLRRRYCSKAAQPCQERAADVRAVIDETVSKREITKALAVFELAQDADKLNHGRLKR